MIAKHSTKNIRGNQLIIRAIFQPGEIGERAPIKVQPTNEIGRTMSARTRMHSDARPKKVRVSGLCVSPKISGNGKERATINAGSKKNKHQAIM
jgi:hypothetical protein